MSQTQCTTDTLRNNDKLTVPLYTDHCSAICFTKVDNSNLRLVRGRKGNSVEMDLKAKYRGLQKFSFDDLFCYSGDFKNLIL